MFPRTGESRIERERRIIITKPAAMPGRVSPRELRRFNRIHSRIVQSPGLIISLMENPPPFPYGGRGSLKLKSSEFFCFMHTTSFRGSLFAVTLPPPPPLVATAAISPSVREGYNAARPRYIIRRNVTPRYKRKMQRSIS